MSYVLPFNSELEVPYRAKKQLQDKIAYIFNHPKVPRAQRDLFKDISTNGSKGLINDMSTVAIGITIYYLKNPQQFGHALENIHFAIVRRMWLKIFHHLHMQNDTRLDENWKYIGITLSMLAVNNGLLDELIRVVTEKDYYKTSDDIPRKKPKRNTSSISNFEYLCGLE